MLNIGCGHRYHKDWINIDVDPATPEVEKVNIIGGLPYADNSMDVVYHSNVLEHLPRHMGRSLIHECYRVLKPGGLLRINIPDLEKICREYLAQMEKAAAGDPEAAHNYQWILIEMLDQVSRNQSGGEMAAYLSQPQIPNMEYLLSRLGSYVTNWREKAAAPKTKKSLAEKIKYVLRHPDRLRRVWHALVLTRKEREQLSIGRFRLGGEVHYWMYDPYSVSLLLKETGFTGISFHTPVTSTLDNWKQYNLDSPDDGAALLVEAFK